MSRLNIAVIGAGYWGKKVIAQILDLARTGDEMNLYSVADSSPMALEQCRRTIANYSRTLKCQRSIYVRRTTPILK